MKKRRGETGPSDDQEPGIQGPTSDGEAGVSAETGF